MDSRPLEVTLCCNGPSLNLSAARGTIAAVSTAITRTNCPDLWFLIDKPAPHNGWYGVLGQRAWLSDRVRKIMPPPDYPREKVKNSLYFALHWLYDSGCRDVLLLGADHDQPKYQKARMFYETFVAEHPDMRIEKGRVPPETHPCAVRP